MPHISLPPTIFLLPPPLPPPFPLSAGLTLVPRRLFHTPPLSSFLSPAHKPQITNHKPQTPPGRFVDTAPAPYNPSIRCQCTITSPPYLAPVKMSTGTNTGSSP